ncbi:hypothetical protein BK648_10805 [Pseudomonas poae]|uniref:DUF3613 domain-containing protein n=1 Tax=Pseudomonas poae TaxID=200451 RepID=A0A423F4W7_9PSED|nr:MULTISPECIES: DUF3613 domain-containing protein [Pseudomonas]ROM49697.1 hypothetical protein BK648_10805 [Pseudomonas poae]TFF02274.1 DUF3613 domain-containing protein [Pseudomonas sp. JMN1]TFF04662.1 DUF3613 domain-containing protein [Pseudomonas sp. BCA17]TFF18889.1 DUF3613 domain-containing protein [Pseudomonas sp. BCA14]TFF20179.1 DUF3613 domain-containing protein [Pseudomonas sp. BCA13]
MKLPYLASLAVLTLPLHIMAMEPGPSSPQQAVTESWLTLQSSGKLASSTPQKATAAERDQAAQRLLDSYKHPIPEFFEQKVGGQTGGNHQ